MKKEITITLDEVFINKSKICYFSFTNRYFNFIEQGIYCYVISINKVKTKKLNIMLWKGTGKHKFTNGEHHGRITPQNDKIQFKKGDKIKIYFYPTTYSENQNLFINFLSENYIKNIYVSKALCKFNRIYYLYDLELYKNNVPCLFFGIYNDDNLNKIKEHKGKRFIMFGGSDIKNKNIFEKFLKIINKNDVIISISKWMKNYMDNIKLTNTYIELDLVDYKIFKPIKNIGNCIYVYDGDGKTITDNTRKNIYNYDLVNKIIKKLPEYNFIRSSELFKKGNTSNDNYMNMPNIYNKCFIGLRLTEYDGNANTVQEFKAMNIPIIHNHSDYGLKWENMDDIINKIKKYDNNSIQIKNCIKKNLFNIENKKILIIVDFIIDLIAGNTIMLTNFINKFKSKKNIVTLLTKHNPGSNFMKNLNDKINIYIFDKIKQLDIDTYDIIFTRTSMDIKELISKKNLCKTIVYGLDAHIDNIQKLNNEFMFLLTQSYKLKDFFIKNKVEKDKIIIQEPFSVKYNFKLPKRNDNKIILIYCGTLRDEENIIEIIEKFKKIHNKRPEVLLKIIWGKIVGNSNFTKKINEYLKKGVKGITFKRNLSHKKACYEIATSDIGICWRKNGWGDNGEISTKVKEYEMYGLEILNENIKNYEELIILYLMKKISDKKILCTLNINFDIKYSVNKESIKLIESELNKWKLNVYTLIKKFNIPDKKIILYCKSVTKATSIGGYVERGHQLLKSINYYSDKYYCICVDSFIGIRKKENIKCVTMIDNVIYISISNILYNLLKNTWSYYAIESYNYIIGLLNIRCLHSPSFFKHSIISIICSKKNNIPHFYEVRGRFDITLFETWDVLKKKKYSNWEKIAENTSQGVFYITNECKKFVEKYDNINKESEILPNCIDIIEKKCNINSILTSKVLFNNSIKFLIGYFGSTYDYENFDLIIPTIDILIQTYKDIGFIFGGNAVNKCRIQLNNLYKKHPKNIILENYLSKEELLLIYKQLNLFVIPRKDILVSHIITPLKPFEILLNKVPLLMSNVSCLKNISGDGKRCRIFNIKENDAFFKAIEDIYKNGYSNELLENGYNFVMNNGWDKTVEPREKLYNKFIS